MCGELEPVISRSLVLRNAWKELSPTNSLLVTSTNSQLLYVIEKIFQYIKSRLSALNYVIACVTSQRPFMPIALDNCIRACCLTCTKVLQSHVVSAHALLPPWIPKKTAQERHPAVIIRSSQYSLRTVRALLFHNFPRKVPHQKLHHPI